MIGKTFGHYKILDTLGKGGMGVVYKAYDSKLERNVAIKVLSEKVLENSRAIDRFKKEAKHHAQLIHTNIVTVYGFIEEENLLGIVMEYVDGESLDKTIYRYGKLQLSDSFYIIKQVLNGLGYAHSKGYVHRDIKPSNVIVNSEGIAKIMDFGISVSVEDESSKKTGVKVGTSYYMSPEQVRGRKVDNKSDIYCTGTTFYEMLTGEPPFYYKDEDEVMRAHIETDPVPVSKKIQGIPSLIDKLISKSMAKNPEERFISCEDFYHNVDQVDLYLAKVTSDYINGRKSTKRISKPASILGTVAILLTLVGLIYFSYILVDEFFQSNQVDKYREFSIMSLFNKDIDFSALAGENLNISSNLNDIYFADEANGFAVGDNGIFLTTNDSGNTWQKSIIDSSVSLKAVYQLPSGTILTVGENSSIFAKSESLNQWEKSEVNITATFNNICFIDKDNGILIGSKGAIFRTIDAGKNWIKTSTPADQLLYDADFSSDKNGIAVGWQGTIFETRDGGYKWEAVAPFTKKYVKAIDFLDNKVAVAVCGGGEIYRTADAGETWNLLNVDVNSPLNDVQFFGESRCLIVGNKGTILYSDNWGKDWKIINSKTFVNLTSVFITENETVYITGINGTLLKF